MARTVLVIALALAFTLVPAAARDAPSAPFQRPSLRVVSMRPFVVRGLDFGTREVVRVVVVSVTRSGRVVRATRAGVFRADFGALRIDPCAGFAVTAKGDRGSRAALQPHELPECPQTSP